MAAEKQWKGPQFICPGTARAELAKKSGLDCPTIVISLSAAPTAISRDWACLSGLMFDDLLFADEDGDATLGLALA
jgi:hypothetical protein